MDFDLHCDDNGQRLGAKILACRLCGAARGRRQDELLPRLHVPFRNFTRGQEGFKRLTAGVAQRFGFKW